jgi:AcrR family transcriptional regulator
MGIDLVPLARWPSLPSVRRYRHRMVEPVEAGEPTDRRILRGRRTRQLILARAVDVASSEGLDGLSLARLGADLKISKSGVKGHFTSREDLQLAVIEVAAKLYNDRVATPALAMPVGLPQLWQLCEGWIEFMRSGELSGRSFFLTALVEYDARPGPIRDELLRLRLQWENLFTATMGHAERHGHLRPGTDPAQLFFEIAALIAGATLDAQIRDDIGVFSRARTAALARLRPLATNETSLPPC